MSKTEETESRLALDAEIDQTECPLTERKNRWIFSLGERAENITWSGVGNSWGEKGTYCDTF